MSSTASGKLYIGSVTDGTTLHYNLTSDKSLVQHYDSDSQSFVPDWTNDESTRPTLTISVRAGSITKSVTAGTWYYNDVEITDSDNRFQIITNLDDVPYKLKIIRNLASETNLDKDLIKFVGSVEVDGTQMDFTAQATVSISEVSSSGCTGVLIFPGNDNTFFTEKGQDIQIGAVLYIGSQRQNASDFTCRWTVNDGTPPTAENASTHTLTLNEADVTDMAIVRCEFTRVGDTESCAVAEVYIDDQSDAEQLYMRLIVKDGATTVSAGNDGGDGQWRVQLRSGQDLTGYIWMGTKTSTTQLTEWTSFKVKVTDASGTVVTSDVIGGTVSSGYADITQSTSITTFTPNLSGGSYGKVTLTSDTLADYTSLSYSFQVSTT